MQKLNLSLKESAQLELLINPQLVLQKALTGQNLMLLVSRVKRSKKRSKAVAREFKIPRTTLRIRLSLTIQSISKVNNLISVR